MASVVNRDVSAFVPEAAGEEPDRPVDPGLSEAKLGCSGLLKTYGGRRVVAVDSLTVRQGETLAILGPNGAGKSTLFRMLALLEDPDEGTVWLDGAPVARRTVEARRKMASVFQRPLLFQGTVAENVGYGLRLRRARGPQVRGLVEEGLEMVGLADFRDADVRKLSGGELQRVALARALVLEPEILFLDEPTSNLDAHVRRRFREEMVGLLESLDSTVVLITHDHAEALVLSDRVALIRNGSVIQCDRTEEVFNHPRNGFAADFMGVENVWSAVVRECAEGLCTVETAAGIVAQLVAERPVGEEVSVAIRPEFVVVSKQAVGDSARSQGVPSSMRNEWPGVVDSVVVTGPLARVRIALAPGGGEEDSLVALVTKPSLEDLGIEKGTQVVAGVKATALYVLEEEG